MSGRRAARTSAVLATFLMIAGLANLLGADWSPFAWTPADRGLPDPGSPSPFAAIYAVGVLLWAVIALAFLGRGGEGPLRAAPRWLVAVICWYAIVSTALGTLTSLGGLAMGWGRLLVVVDVLLVAFGITAMVRTAPARTAPAPRP